MGMNSHSFSSPLLISSAYKCLHPSFCLFKSWRKKKIADTNSATKSVDIESIQEEKGFLLIHQGGKTDDL